MEYHKIKIPEGLHIADKLPKAIYTPSTKADVGEHDENIDFESTVKLLGQTLAEQVRDVSLKLYRELPYRKLLCGKCFYLSTIVPRCACKRHKQKHLSYLRPN